MSSCFVSLCDRCWYLPHNEETDRPILGYVLGDRFSLMVDAGNSPVHLAIFTEELRLRGLPMPAYTVITHWHWDHTYAMAALPWPAIACDKTNQQLKVMQSWGWSDQEISARLQSGEDISFCTDMIVKEYPDRHKIQIKTADVVFDRTLSLDLGGVICHLLHLGGSHSPDSVVVHLPEEKLLFLGDCIYEDLYHGEVYYPDLLEEMIAVLEGMEFETGLVSHCVPMTKKAVLEYLRAARNR